MKKAQAKQINQLLAIIYALLALAVIIAVLGIINTLVLSVVERRRELDRLSARLGSRRVSRMIAQDSHIPELAAGLVHDWPFEGICSAPFVEGKRIYYVSNRCELICATTDGLKDGKNEGFKDEKYHTEKDAWQPAHRLELCS